MRPLFVFLILTALVPSNSHAAACADNLDEETSLLELFSCIGELNDEVAIFNQRVASEMAEAAIPKDAVVAFDSSRGCPAGWSAFGAGDGRTIIGVTSGKSDASVRFFRETGGAERVTLNIEELTPHQHSSPTVSDPGVKNFGFSTDVPSAMGGTSWNRGHLAGTTSFVGEGAPHDNMPPFIALHWCKKN